MAIYYCDEDLLTGLNDGTSWADAYQTWSGAVTGIGTLSENSTLYIRSTGAVQTTRNTTFNFSGNNLDVIGDSSCILAVNSEYTGAIFINQTDATAILTLRGIEYNFSTNMYGIHVNNSIETHVFSSDFIGTAGRRGIYVPAAAANVLVDGVSFAGAETGIGNTGAGTVLAKNCYSDGSLLGYTNSGGGVLTLTTCASSDTTGSAGLQNIPYSTATFVNVTPGSEDFNLVLGSLLIGNGTVTTNLTDINGVEFGAPRDIGSHNYTSAILEADPNDIVHGAIIVGTTTASNNYITSDFTYAQINDGFSGFYNFVDNPLQRKFGENAVLFLKITGTEATLKVGGGSAPYAIYVDGTQSIPTVSAGRITLFTGLSDTIHTVAVMSKPASINLFNYITIDESDTLKVTGETPSIITLPFDYISDPSFLGLTSYSEKAKTYADLTPTYDEVKPNSYERGQIIFDSICDEIWVYTDSDGALFSVDGAAPSAVTFPETELISGIRARRAVLISNALDNTQRHSYRIWATTDESFGIQGVLALKNNIIATISTPVGTYQKTLMIGASVVAGSEGNIQGYADSFIISRNLDLLMTKAGNAGNTTGQTTTDLPSIITANGMPEIAIFGASTNDNGDAGIEAKYTTLINNMLSEGIATVICRGVVPYLSALNVALKSAVDTLANPNVYYVESQTWAPIDTIDGTHPTILGYTQLATFEEPEFQSIIVQAIPNDFTSGQSIFESITASAEIIAELSDFISGQAIFGSVSEYSNAIYYKSIKTKSDMTTKITTIGEIA